MKQFFTLFLLVITIHATAQSYPFPDSGAVWVQTFSMMTTPPPLPEFEVQAVANIGANGEDTLINGVAYTKLVDIVEGTYYGAVRDDNGVVLLVPVDSIQEFVLYDFTATAGTVIEDVIFYQGFPMDLGGPTVMDLEVSQVSTWPEFGDRKVVDVAGGGVWIEGIGNMWGLFTEPFPNVSNYMLRLECMSHLDTIRYSEMDQQLIGTVGTCAPIIMGIEDAGRNGFSIHPNPTSEMIFIAGEIGPIDVEVLDPSGKIVQSARSINGVIDVTRLESGMYLLRMGDHEERRIQRFMKL
jgi:hypothetical protein